VLIMDWQGEHVTLLNLHAVPTTLAVTTNSAGLSRKLVDGLRSMAARVEASVSLSTRERERQAQVIVDYVISHPGPTIVLADLNAGDQSDAYARLVGRAGGSVVDKLMVDSWREAGWGMGHTFPGAASTGSSRPTIGGVPIVPKWLVRIDYVFHSRHWCALSARIGPWDGISDHRPVWVRLVLRET
jgi:endonuclease/exonuclease/phosphatase family metal-dependent hydrolase